MSFSSVHADESSATLVGRHHDDAGRGHRRCERRREDASGTGWKHTCMVFNLASPKEVRGVVRTGLGPA